MKQTICYYVEDLHKPNSEAVPVFANAPVDAVKACFPNKSIGRCFIGNADVRVYQLIDYKNGKYKEDPKEIQREYTYKFY